MTLSGLLVPSFLLLRYYVYNISPLPSNGGNVASACEQEARGTHEEQRGQRRTMNHRYGRKKSFLGDRDNERHKFYPKTTIYW